MCNLALASGAEVLGWVRTGDSIPGVSSCRVDINDQDTVDKSIADFKPDWIFHLASIVPKFAFNPNGDDMLSVNVSGTYHLLNSVGRYCSTSKVLVSGSSSVYGNCPHTSFPISEDFSLVPLSLYATSKIAQDMLAYQFFIEQDLLTIRARTFNQLGPGEGADRVCGAIAHQIARIEAGLQHPVIRIRSSVPKRDFTDVRDVVAGYWAALSLGEVGSVYNICSGRSRSVGEIIEGLLEVSRINHVDVVEIDGSSRTNDIMDQIGSAKTLSTKTSWCPVISFEDSLRDLLDDWRLRI